MASGSYDETVRLWDAAIGAALQTLEGHSDLVVSSVAFSPDGKHIVSGSYDKTVRLWDAATGAVLQTLEGHSRAINSVAFSPDDKHVVSGSDDNTVRLWDAITGATPQTLKGHSSWVRSVAFSPDGKHVASGAYDGTVRLWKAETGAGQAPSPVESNHRQASGALNSSGLENGNAERSSSTSNSPPPSSSKRVLRPTTGQALLPSKGKASHKDGRPQPAASASLGPVHSSKVSKAAVKKKPRPQRRLSISPNVSSDGLPLSSGVDTAEPQPSPPLDRVAPRRSKRIQPPVSSVAKDPAKTASTDPSKRAVRSQQRKVASTLKTRSSAKPQGVSKRQPAKTTRGKGKENMNN